MKIHRSTDYVHIDLTPAEARVLLEELSDVRGGSRMPKIRQMCSELASSLALLRPTPVSVPRSGKKRSEIPAQVISMKGWKQEDSAPTPVDLEGESE